MENERLRVTLDSPNYTYIAGQPIKGEIWLNITKRTKIRAVKVQITGKGKCKWMEILRKNSNSNNESTRSLFYSSKEIYVHNEITLPVFEPRGIELSPGEHSFDFSLDLENFLPSSFKGSHGSIKYKLRILIRRPWCFDERHSIPIIILKNMPLPPINRHNPTPLQKQITKTISLFGTRPISMLALLPEDFAVRGEHLRICVTVTNNSTTNVEKLRFCVLQNISYYSHLPLRIQKLETIPITHKETGAVHKKSERSFAHELLIPETAQPTDDELSGVINITYELRVEAVLRGFFKNLVLSLPFKIYSNEASSLSNPPMPTEVPNNGAGNPFEQPTNTVTMYPTLDAAVSSPSHSSLYSSESSSLHSTTSESSATTLSPAVGGTVLSYTSGSSSQFNSPSNHASLRTNSNVPYMPYSNSPLMINSYPPPTGNMPPYPISDSPQYTLMHQHSLPNPGAPTPPPTMNNLNLNSSMSAHYASVSSSTYMAMRPQPGAHELPPSYEELFGTPTAPPETSK